MEIILLDLMKHFEFVLTDTKSVETWLQSFNGEMMHDLRDIIFQELRVRAIPNGT